MFSSRLDTVLTYLEGVGPHRAEVLKKEYGLKTYADLLQYFPYRYEDKTQVQEIAKLHDGLKKILVRGTIFSKNDVGAGRKRRLVLELQDQTGSMELIWFKGVQWIAKNVAVGDEVSAYGRLTVFNGTYSISHPEIVTNTKGEKKSALTPFYSTSEYSKKMGVDSKWMAKVTSTLVHQLQPTDIPETLPDYILERYRLPSRFLAYQWIHHPPDQKHMKHALRRLKFEELFWMQLEFARLKLRNKKPPSHKLSLVGDLFNTYYREHLPFELTAAQKRVIKELRFDMSSGSQMNRLVQGDVGSGKTVVALLCMLLALDNGTQACLMAPTEILAQQHFISFKEALEPMGIEVELLTGSTKGAAKKALLSRLESGDTRIVIGTHALIEPTVQFQNLGLIVIDEQHKFGVAQRAKLGMKNDLVPHIMVMTATPIPRSLAMTAYGPMDISTIDELPAGRKPIITQHAMSNKRIDVMSFVANQIRDGRQVYIVYPLIEESEKLDYESLERGYEEIKSYFPELDSGISLVHGKQNIELRETNMRRFVEGRTKILVATTVIEVGVNIPNATVMVIESSERFGLSQLHQLRGRVGRGGDQSYCILMTGYKLSEDAKKRISIMVDTTDGFKIAEQDLLLRGPGNMLGTQQSGALDLQLVDLETDQKILEVARNTAIEILADDPELISEKNKVLRNYLQFRLKQDWSEVL